MRRIGICWHGAAGTPVEYKRPTDFGFWHPLLDTEGVEWQCLQFGERPDLRMQPCPSGDILDTMNRISGLDLVITADTSIAHLAASMGIQTWMLLYRPAEWRWELNGDTTAWYPSMRIFRQERRGEWGPVFDRLAKELRAVVASGVEYAA